jgi:cardiolipin synthase
MLRHLPNVITLARIGACAPLAWLILDGEDRAALWLALAMGVSDVLDGMLARKFGWQSRLGGLLDPVADKLFMIAAFLALGAVGALPLWLIALVLLRDVVIVAGAFAYNRLVEPVPAAPSTAGKACTLAQVMLVLAVLTGRAGLPLPEPGVEILITVVAALALVSGGHYVWVWSRRARAVWRQRAGV